MGEAMRRFVELRADGERRVSGVAVAYGDVSPQWQERFTPGSIELEPVLNLNVQHDRGRPVAGYPDGGLRFTDSPEAMEVSAELADTSEGRDAWTNVRGRILRGFSLEFVALEERLEGALRVIERAALVGIALVDRPSYPASTVQARALDAKRRQHAAAACRFNPWEW